MLSSAINHHFLGLRFLRINLSQFWSKYVVAYIYKICTIFRQSSSIFNQEIHLPFKRTFLSVMPAVKTNLSWCLVETEDVTCERGFGTAMSFLKRATLSVADRCCSVFNTFTKHLKNSHLSKFALLQLRSSAAPAVAPSLLFKWWFQSLQVLHTCSSHKVLKEKNVDTEVPICVLETKWLNL